MEAAAGEWLRSTNADPSMANPLLERVGSAPLKEPTRLAALLRRPNVSVLELADTFGGLPGTDEFDRRDVLVGLEMEVRYDGYLERERERAAALRRQSEFALPSDLDYESLRTLSTEARQKLARVRPATLGQAGRIPGISPSDLQNLVMEVRKRRARQDAAGVGASAP